MGLALDIGLGGLTLRVEGVEVLLQPMLGRHPVRLEALTQVNAGAPGPWYGRECLTFISSPARRSDLRTCASPPRPLKPLCTVWTRAPVRLHLTRSADF